MYVTESFLGTLADADRRALLSQLQVRRFVRSSILMRQGEVGTNIAVLLSGRVKLIARAPSGSPVLLGIRGPGELLSELAVLANGTRTADAVAMEDAAAGYTTADVFLRFLAERPTIAMTLIRTLAGRVREADVGRIGLATNDALGRLADRLLDLSRLYATDTGTNVQFDLPFTQDELASWVGVSRQAVARALAQMRSAGWLSNEGKRVVLHDLDVLRDQANR